jgi:hypothetical protein
MAKALAEVVVLGEDVIAATMEETKLDVFEAELEGVLVAETVDDVDLEAELEVVDTAALVLVATAT